MFSYIVDMGEAIEQLDGELVVNGDELQRIQHYKVVRCYMYIYGYGNPCLTECSDVKKQF